MLFLLLHLVATPSRARLRRHRCTARRSGVTRAGAHRPHGGAGGWQHFDARISGRRRALAPRNLYAFARDGRCRLRSSHLHPRFRTPWIAILVHAVLRGRWRRGSFGVLILLSNVAVLVGYLLCCLVDRTAAPECRGCRRPFQLPDTIVPALACFVVLWLLSHATAQKFAVTSAAVRGVAAFAWRRRSGLVRSSNQRSETVRTVVAPGRAREAM